MLSLNTHWSNLQKCGKKRRPALNDTCSQSNKLENFLTQQKILRSINDEGSVNDNL